MADQGAVRREADRLVVSPIEAEENPPSLLLLRKLIDERLPRVDITELLIEVDNLTGFSNSFQHLDGVATRGSSGISVQAVKQRVEHVFGEGEDRTILGHTWTV